tara:strand:- start:870 stop:1166 length:297 start_codon:yes stop_codon:yes gene_type:complete
MISPILTLISAIKNLNPNAEVKCTSIDDIEWRKGDPISKSEIEAEIERIKKFEKYKEDRILAFPSIGDQLDMQYWDQVNGTTTWKDAIAKVKSDHPKP